MADQKTRQQEYIALCRKRDIAAFAVVGAAKAIFRAYPISEIGFKLGVEAIKDFDRADMAVKEFELEDQHDVANHTQRRAG